MNGIGLAVVHLVRRHSVKLNLPLKAEVAFRVRGVISVLLSNIYQHYVLDLWLERNAKPRLRGEAYLVRYIDDLVVCFQYRDDALRLQDALRKRLGKFGLTLEPTKTKLIEFGRFAQRHAGKHGRKRLETIYFLGFTLYCTRNRNGDFKVGMRTEKSRLRRSLMSLQEKMRQIGALSRRWVRRIDVRERNAMAPKPADCPTFCQANSSVSELAHVVGHVAGGRPPERLMKRLGLPQSDDTILRKLKRHQSERGQATPVRVAVIDDWSWRKGCSYGTIVVDLERREVVDVLADRSPASTAELLRGHPEVELVSRDRAGLYAEGACQGAPMARQVADRFHLLQNLRETIEQQLSRAPRPARQPAVDARFWTAIGLDGWTLPFCVEWASIVESYQPMLMSGA